MNDREENERYTICLLPSELYLKKDFERMGYKVVEYPLLPDNIEKLLDSKKRAKKSKSGS